MRLIRSMATAVRTKPPLQFKPQLNSKQLAFVSLKLNKSIGWKPKPEHAQVLNSIANEFKSKLVLSPDDPSKLSEALGYGISESDLEKLQVDGEQYGGLQELLSLKYADQSQLNNYNKHQAIRYFARGVNDTGSPEVQGTCLLIVSNPMYTIIW